MLICFAFFIPPPWGCPHPIVPVLDTCFCLLCSCGFVCARVAMSAAANAGRVAGPNTLSVLERVAVLGPRQYQVPQSVLKPNPQGLSAEQSRLQTLRLYRKIVRSVPRVLM